jgi:hypothetical protein
MHRVFFKTSHSRLTNIISLKCEQLKKYSEKEGIVLVV